MFTEPILASKIRVRLHWGNTAEELEEDVNGVLEAYPKHAIYRMDYHLSSMLKDDNEFQEKHRMVVFYRP